jgi:hypothetical protein
MAEFTSAGWVAACAALDLDPATTLSINISPDYVRIVHTDQAVTSQPIAIEPPSPEPEEA